MCRAGLDDVLLVTESQVRAAMSGLLASEGLVVEGAGAVAVAALEQVRHPRRLVVVTGGNVDPAHLSPGLPLPTKQSIYLNQ